MALTVAAASLPAQAAPDSTRRPSPAAAGTADTLSAERPGALAGRVLDASGNPLGGADVLILGTARRDRTRPDGSFLIPGLGPGTIEFVVRKLGFQPVDDAVGIPPGRQVALQIRLRPYGALEKVVVTAQIFNELRGVVTDTSGKRLDSVEVSLAGERRFRTAQDGEFVFADVTPGKWLLRFSRPGYTPKLLGLTMVAQLERDLAVQLRPREDGTQFEVSDAVAWEEHESRRAWMGPSGGALVTREDLARWGDQPLDLTLRNAAPAAMMLFQSPQGSGTRQAPTGFGAGVAQQGMTSGGACILLDGLQPLWNQGLQTFMASQVESVEVFPPNTDQTRSGCSRFPVSNACGCGASNVIPGYFVIWSRR